MLKKMLDNKINWHVTVWFAYWRTADFLVVAAELMRERISVTVFWQRTKMDLASKAVRDVQGGFLLATSWNGELKWFSGGPHKEMSICDSCFTEMGVNPSAIYPCSRSSSLLIPSLSVKFLYIQSEKRRVTSSFFTSFSGLTLQSHGCSTLNPYGTLLLLNYLLQNLSQNQHRQRRSLFVTSSEEWTTFGTNPLFTPSQPSWIVMSPDRTRAKMSLVSSVKARSTLMASRADVST